MNEIILGLGDYGASKTPGTIIKTYALGSCVAVMLYDPVIQAAGMVHVVLPDSSIDSKKAQQKPGYFADTGISSLLALMEQLGSSGQVWVKLAGGAQIADPNFRFNVGKRNTLAVKKCLWALRLGALTEDLGGDLSRTVALRTDDGMVVLSNPKKGEWMI
ncbi:MAG: chemotaxis protein CheD [SAR324 cluster bacterium]|nr:chemotaxis protein CheD [SAR324 cluster bacterium]